MLMVSPKVLQETSSMSRKLPPREEITKILLKGWCQYCHQRKPEEGTCCPAQQHFSFGLELGKQEAERNCSKSIKLIAEEAERTLRDRCCNCEVVLATERRDRCDFCEHMQQLWVQGS